MVLDEASSNTVWTNQIRAGVVWSIAYLYCIDKTIIIRINVFLKHLLVFFMSFETRIKQLIDYQCDGNIKKFSKQLGIPYTTVIDYTKGVKKDPKISFILKILDHSTQVNVRWLVTGLGEMLIEEEEDLRQENERLKEVIKDLKRELKKTDTIMNQSVELVDIKSKELAELKKQLGSA